MSEAHTRISKQDVLAATVELHKTLRRPVDYIEVATYMNARPTVIQDHLKNLRDDGDLVHHPRKGYEPVKTIEIRPVTATQLEDGGYKVELGDECLTLKTPAEVLSLWDLLTPAGERHRNNQLMFNTVELVNQLMTKVQRLEKTVKDMERSPARATSQYSLALPVSDEIGPGMER